MMKLSVSVFAVVSIVLVGALVVTGHWTVGLVVIGLASIAAAEVYSRSQRPASTRRA